MLKKNPKNSNIYSEYFFFFLKKDLKAEKPEGCSISIVNFNKRAM